MTARGNNCAFGTRLDKMVPAIAHSDHMRAVFSGFPAAVVAICAFVSGKPQGIVATSLSVGVSFDPPMALFSIQHSSSTWPLLRTSKRLGVSMLREDQGELCRDLSSKTGEQFTNADTGVNENNALFIKGATTWLDCEVADELPAGDHSIVLLRIHSIGHDRLATPLIFHKGAFPRLEDNKELK